MYIYIYISITQTGKKILPLHIYNTLSSSCSFILHTYLDFLAYPFMLNSCSKNENQNLHHITICKSTVDKATANIKEVTQFVYDIWMSNLTQN